MGGRAVDGKLKSSLEWPYDQHEGEENQTAKRQCMH